MILNATPHHLTDIASPTGKTMYRSEVIPSFRTGDTHELTPTELDDDLEVTTTELDIDLTVLTTELVADLKVSSNELACMPHGKYMRSHDTHNDSFIVQ